MLFARCLCCTARDQREEKHQHRSVEDASAIVCVRPGSHAWRHKTTDAASRCASRVALMHQSVGAASGALDTSRFASSQRSLRRQVDLLPPRALHGDAARDAPPTHDASRVNPLSCTAGRSIVFASISRLRQNAGSVGDAQLGIEPLMAAAQKLAEASRVTQRTTQNASKRQER